MSIAFKDADHSYTSTDQDSITWTSVTSLVSNFKQPFEAKKIATAVSKNKKSKWYGLKPEEIMDIWKNEGLRAVTLGTFYHNQREEEICSFNSIQKEGKNLPVFKPIVIDGIKYAPEQKLEEGVYPEHMVFLKSSGLCGQSDLVEVVNGKIYIIDYKTNKEIKMESYVDYEGNSKKMLDPVCHLDDCEFYHYALQLSIYMYIINKHNPKLKPGKMFIYHIKFEEEGKDEYGYPITKYDEAGNPIVKEVIPIEIPYLKEEVLSIINWLKYNKENLKSKK